MYIWAVILTAAAEHIRTDIYVRTLGSIVTFRETGEDKPHSERTRKWPHLYDKPLL